MSENTGDKARYGRQRKRKIGKRESARVLRKQILAPKQADGKGKQSAAPAESAPT